MVDAGLVVGFDMGQFQVGKGDLRPAPAARPFPDTAYHVPCKGRCVELGGYNRSVLPKPSAFMLHTPSCKKTILFEKDI